MGLRLLPKSIRNEYEVHEWKHALAVLRGDFPKEFRELVEVLEQFRLKKSHVGLPGGNITPISKSFNAAFRKRSWQEKSFDTKIVVDTNELIAPTHLVDCFKNRVALEIEWNNKDPFFDRDLNNFRLLFELRAVSVGVIITKSNQLIETLTDLGIFSKYGMTTTWMSKLLPRIEGGGGGGCPIVVFGITPKRYDADISDDDLDRVREAVKEIKTLPKKRQPVARKIVAEALAADQLPRDLAKRVRDAILEAHKANAAQIAAAANEEESEDED